MGLTLDTLLPKMAFSATIQPMRQKTLTINKDKYILIRVQVDKKLGFEPGKLIEWMNKSFYSYQTVAQKLSL